MLPKGRYSLFQNMNMTTLTINIENPSIIPSLRKVLSALDGVTIAKPVRKAAKAKTAHIPNELTIAAMKEVESGIDAGEVKLDNIDNFIASMM